jgi:hypothetical protein
MPGDPAAKFRSRIVEFIPECPADRIRPNAANWRLHPEYQSGSMLKILERIGFVTGVVTRRIAGDPNFDYELIDGHLRKDLSAGSLVPNLVTDLSDAEAREVLATFDPVSQLAVPDTDKLSGLVKGLQGLSVPLMEMGWPEFRLEQITGAGWVPKSGAGGTGAIGSSPAGGNPSGGSPGEPFQPGLAPAVGDGTVTAGDVEKAAGGMAERVGVTDRMIPTICTHCAKEFLINAADIQESKR